MEQSESNEHTRVVSCLILQAHAIQPGQAFVGRTKPDQEIGLYVQSEGRCDVYAQRLSQTKADAAGYFRLWVPEDVEYSYEGLLFRVFWEIRCGLHQQRVYVTQDGQPISDPYQALGLKHNPFKAEEIDLQCREAWRGIDAKRWLERGYSQAPQPQSRQFIQLLGVKGAGKSSHLAHWRQQESGPYHYVDRRWSKRWKQPLLAPICYWDEVCRMPKMLLWPSLLKASLAGHTICVGTHKDLSVEARFFGFSVTTIAFGKLTTSEVEQWAKAHIQAAAFQAEPALKLSASLAEQMAKQAKGSWRDLGENLHVWAAREGFKALVK